MQNRPRIIFKLGLLGAAVVMAPVAAQSPAPRSGAGAEAATGSEVTVTITDLRNSKGVVRACMTNDPERFPRCRDDAQSYRLVVSASEAGTLRFRNVAPGTYAIALLHDENGNGKADRALSMIPREGFGFSRDAAVNLGPPSFGDAAITVGTANQRQAIKMRYLL